MAKTTDAFSRDEKRTMSAALGLARRSLGETWPNPSVGCVLARPDLGRDGKARIVGRGWTQPGGRPHAETEALARAGELARGATAFVTLEPCCHVGQTGPCTGALIDAGISRAIIAIEDPDPRVSGKGVSALDQAGIETGVGLLADHAREINLGFISKIRLNRPMVTLKLATSLDGRIATAGGDSKWITGAVARARGHLLRAEHDAILVGRGTVTADNPSLTCRLPGMAKKSPVRVVLDSHLKTSKTAKLVDTARQIPTWIIAGDSADTGAEEALTDLGSQVFRVSTGASDRPEPAAILACLADQGITRVLIEGGADVAASFMAAGLVDRIAWFRAPVAIGNEGLPGLAAMGFDDLAQAPRFQRISLEHLGDDVLELLAVGADAA